MVAKYGASDQPDEKRGFYEKVTDVNTSFLFFLRWRLCFSFRLQCMLFSTMFLYALSLSHSALCQLGSYGEVDAASFRSASLRAQPRAQSSERGIVATGAVIFLSQAAAA